MTLISLAHNMKAFIRESSYFQIQWGACYLTIAGNIVVYLTLVGFFLTFEQDYVDYNAW